MRRGPQQDAIDRGVASGPAASIEKTPSYQFAKVAVEKLAQTEKELQMRTLRPDKRGFMKRWKQRSKKTNDMPNTAAPAFVSHLLRALSSVRP